MMATIAPARPRSINLPPSLLLFAVLRKQTLSFLLTTFSLKAGLPHTANTCPDLPTWPAGDWEAKCSLSEDCYPVPLERWGLLPIPKEQLAKIKGISVLQCRAELELQYAGCMYFNICCLRFHMQESVA
jgi:hypothetical protein